MARRILNAKEIDYSAPGSVAAAYGWTPENIDKAIASRTGGGTKNATNVRSHIDKYLGDPRRNTTLDTASPNQRIAALDYAFREESRQQQTKKGFFDTFIGKVISIGGQIAAGALGGPWAAAAVGATTGGIQGGVKGAILGGASGYGIGKGVQGVQGFMGGGKALTNVNQFYATAQKGAAAGASGAMRATAAGGGGILASAGSTATRAMDAITSRGGTLLMSGATALAGGIGAAAAPKPKPIVAPPKPALLTAGSQVVDINSARVRAAATKEGRAVSRATGVDDTVRTGSRGVLQPARTRRKQVLGA